MTDNTTAVGALDDGALLEAVRQAKDRVGSDEAGLVHLMGGACRAAAHTGETAARLDRLQCDLDEGPSLVAIRQLQAMSVPDVAALDWWPAFRRAALKGGVRSCLAVPRTLGNEVIGAIAFYSRDPNALAGREEAGLQAADEAGVVIAGTGVPPPPRG